MTLELRLGKNKATAIGFEDIDVLSTIDRRTHQAIFSVYELISEHFQKAGVTTTYQTNFKERNSIIFKKGLMGRDELYNLQYNDDSYSVEISPATPEAWTYLKDITQGQAININTESMTAEQQIRRLKNS